MSKTANSFENQGPSYADRVAQLSRKSVEKHFDAYADVDWDAPENRIELDDPRFELSPEDPLGGTEWYRSLPQSARAVIGLEFTAQQMKTGLIFESVLSQGLLQFAQSLPNGAPEYRYAYHELIEEGQHQLMFQEFINRSGLNPKGLSPFEAWGARRVPSLGRTFPELFFLFVLGGEAPIDHVQRTAIRDRSEMHPLLERIMRIHVLEEARHLCFADNFLRERIPKLGAFKRLHLQVRTPFILGLMSRQMLEPPKALVKAYQIPDRVVQAAYVDNPVHRQSLLDGLASVRKLCVDAGVVQPWSVGLWRRFGIWEDEVQGLLPASN